MVWGMMWADADFRSTPSGKPKITLIAAVAAELSSGPRNDEPATVAVADRLPRASKGGGRISSGSTDNVSNLLAKFSGLGNQPEDIERDLNLSSLDRVELMSALEQRYQIELNETAFAEAK